ncbi:MAG: hypothetical protein ACLGHC_07240 [Alphaproteobacteria bacterium]
MLKDVLLAILAAILPVLIVLKSDKQMAHLLEGKLFRRGQETSAAKAVYSRHKEPVSALLFAGGCWLAVAGLLIFDTGPLGIALALVGAGCALFGVVGRMRSFRAADKELG